MENKRILFQYFGQPRMVKECLSWQEYFIKILADDALKLDINLQIHHKYDLWTKRGASQLSVTADGLEPVNTNTITADIHSVRPQAEIHWHDYDRVECEWQKLGITEDNGNLYRINFYKVFSQTIIKGVACETITDDWDLVIMVRTDNIFWGQQREFLKLLKQSTYIGEGINTVYVSGLSYTSYEGFRCDDQVFISDVTGIKNLYYRWSDKIKYYIVENNHLWSGWLQRVGPHEVAVSFIKSIAYNLDHKKEWRDKKSLRRDVNVIQNPFKDFYLILRDHPDCLELAKDICEENFLELRKLQKVHLNRGHR